MFPPGWSIWSILLTLPISACHLEICRCDSHEVICSQGLSNCNMKDEMPLTEAENKAVDVQNLTPYFKLCCKDGVACALYLVIDTEVIIHLDKDMEDKDHSGLDEEDYIEETRNPKVSVTVCYNAVSTMPRCKKVEFNVNHAALAQQNHAKFSMVITKPAGVSFSSQVVVFSSKPPHLREVVAPSLDEVCTQELQERVAECHVPRLSNVSFNKEMNQVELRFAGQYKSRPSVCIQNERNGRCQRWDTMTIPVYSVTPCMCFQVWDEDNQESRRSQSCPFKHTDVIQRNIWQNVSVSAGPHQMKDHSTMLLWNLSAPCRLEGEVWPCHKESSCREMKGFRQQLENGTWRQNSGKWEKIGVFEDINLQLSPCVMVRVKGMRHELGPFCFNNTDRQRWSLLFVGVMLLICLTVLIFFLLRGFVKKWVWSWHHGGFVEIGRKHRVVLLSPPDVDNGVLESICRLGSLLCNQGFSVSVDQWSRREQCTWGPLPWLHSQVLELNSQGGRVVLVLTRKALERAEEWTHRRKDVIKTKEEDKGLSQICSSYSDVFTACLWLIQVDMQLGRARERFVLVKYDSHPRGDRNLPELLQGLPLFQLPSQTQALMSELSVARTGRQPGRTTWTGWKWSASDRRRAKTKEGLDQQKASHWKYAGAEKNLETEPLKRLQMSC
ncbi:uncharacterized protein il17rc [Pempheris klunzingeri]|uniref:uncharacterized protein il17rc n=1 Tax=Pempheris klunzingeri TaxID=3127111 RepID=UPI00397EA9C7